MITDPFITQAIGFIAFGLGVFSFLQKNDNRLRYMMMAQGVTLCIHFILLGAYTGAAATFIVAVRNGLSVFKWAKKLALVFYASTAVFGIITYTHPVDILPIIAGFVGTTAFFYFSGIRMRLALVTGASLWLTHNIIVGSIGPSLMEAVMIGAGLYRAYNLHLENAENGRPS